MTSAPVWPSFPSCSRREVSTSLPGSSSGSNGTVTFASAEVLRIVLHDEIGHVEVGSRWFAHVCDRRGLDPTAEFERLVAEYSLLIVPPFNVEARVAAGFSEVDLHRWEAAFLGARGTPR